VKRRFRIWCQNAAVLPWFGPATHSPWSQEKGGSMAKTCDYETLNERALTELRLKTEAAAGLFRLDERNWVADHEAGTITFDHPNGTRATAPLQIVGTYNPQDGTWLWAWSHPSILESLRAHAETVRRYGVEHDIEELQSAKLDCSEDDCWRFAALACHLNGAQGAYRGPTAGPLVFLTYGAVTLSDNAR
jgi:hypothetical protein